MLVAERADISERRAADTKLCAFREKDRDFVGALLRVGLVDGDAIAARLPTVKERYRQAAHRAVDWIASWDAGPPRTAD